MVQKTKTTASTTQKATKRATGKTAEERKAEVEALHRQLTVQVEALTSTEEWAKFLQFAQSFHAYSFNNLMLILSQRPTATAVAGFRQWQDKGRQVRKGEKSIKIFGYSSKKVTVENTETGEEEEKKVPRFPILSVFDIDQTDLIDGSETGESHSNPVTRLTGEDEAGISTKVTTYLESLGWTVEREEIPGETNGYTTTDGTKRVAVDSRLSPAQSAKTLVHEAAHVLMHAHEDPAQYVAHRGLKETEAESVAYVVAGMLGLDTSAYSVGYIAGWANADLDLIHSTAANVLTTVHILADALTHNDHELAA
ncbi:ArdC-like ssDNA-binding domain-containing protein [Arthrobacter pityocampae]|uniref:ArdC-like ssDNA-binding domain-containing protein n=1 Tax=Arthrobacter pityocampae TaxID=547334 RepID=UPI003734FAAD